MDDLERFEAGVRRRRHITIGVLIALGGAAAGVFVYATRKVAKEAGRPGVPVVDVRTLSEAERADIEAQTGLRLPGPAPVCPDGMVGVPARGGVAAFCLDARDVTIGEFLACVDAGECPDFPKSPLCPDLRAVPRDRVVPCVEYEPAAAYCRWVGRRMTIGDELLSAFDTVGMDMQLRCAASSS